jgi:superfamily II DNA helicase RecQ
MVFRGYVWAWRMQPDDANKLRRIRMYHALCAPEDNEGTIRLLEEDPYCQIVFATVAFANGLNVKSLINSLSLGFAETLNQMWQEKGRVGRDPHTLSRGVVFLQPSVLAVAKKRIQADSSAPVPLGKRHKKKPAEPMELVKSQLLLESVCYIARLNRIYDNLPSEFT